MRLPPRCTRTDTLVPYACGVRAGEVGAAGAGRVLREAGLHERAEEVKLGIAARGAVAEPRLETGDPAGGEGGAGGDQSVGGVGGGDIGRRSDEHTSELQSLMSISYAVFCLQTQSIKTENKH